MFNLPAVNKNNLQEVMESTFAESATPAQALMTFNIIICFCAEGVWQNRTQKY